MYSSLDGRFTRAYFSQRCLALVGVVSLLILVVVVLFSSSGSNTPSPVASEQEKAETPAPFYIDNPKPSDERVDGRKKHNENKKKKHPKRLKDEDNYSENDEDLPYSQKEQVSLTSSPSVKTSPPTQVITGSPTLETGAPSQQEQLEVEEEYDEEEEEEEEVENSVVEFKDDYYHDAENESVECESNQLVGLKGGIKVQFMEIPRNDLNNKLRKQLEAWIESLSSTVKVARVKKDENSIECPKNIDTASFLIGQRGWGYCKRLVAHKTPLKTLVVLKNPITRMLEILREDYAISQNISELIEALDKTPQIEDLELVLKKSGTDQARFLCGVDCVSKIHSSSGQEESFYLTRALEHINKADALGFAHTLDEFLPQLQYLLPAIVPPSFSSFQLPLEETNVMASSLSVASRAILRRWAQVDHDLFVAALDLFKMKDEIARHCIQ